MKWFEKIESNIIADQIAYQKHLDDIQDKLFEERETARMQNHLVSGKGIFFQIRELPAHAYKELTYEDIKKYVEDVFEEITDSKKPKRKQASYEESLLDQELYNLKLQFMKTKGYEDNTESTST